MTDTLPSKTAVPEGRRDRVDDLPGLERPRRFSGTEKSRRTFERSSSVVMRVPGAT